MDLDGVTIYHGDCLDVLPTLLTESVHAVITDPPYELGFMGKQWDGTGIAFRPDVWRECLRVLRPGGHLLAFGGTRTAHRLTCAIEDAGFDIRDTITWLYGTGFPKSLDVSKAIDKAAGAERDVIGDNPNHRPTSGIEYDGIYAGANTGAATLTAPATADAHTWQGWGTALKPPHEPIIAARKPLTGTVAANVLEYGTGGLNIDACRVVTTEDTRRNARGGENGLCETGTFKIRERRATDQPQRAGRWPPNVILTHADECGGDCAGWTCAPECPVAELDTQSGTCRSSGVCDGDGSRAPGVRSTTLPGGHRPGTMYADSGGASRFFPVFHWQAKAPASERPRVDGVVHPTVKPLALLRWLTRLVAPPGGVVLDPFLGSGTTAQAARDEGFRCIGIEREADYLPLIRARLSP